IADWYNPIIQHGEVDFRDPRRDHTRGRIWRVTAKGRPLVERPKLVDAPIPKLLDHLSDPEDWTRQQARRVLKERTSKKGPPMLANGELAREAETDADRARREVTSRLSAWIKMLDPRGPDYEHQRLEALWTYQALDEVEPELLATLLKSPDA